MWLIMSVLTFSGAVLHVSRYLQERGVLCKVVPRNPQVHHPVQAHTAHRDQGLHNHHRDFLLDLHPLRTVPFGENHKNSPHHRMDYPLVGRLLLDNPAAINKKYKKLVQAINKLIKKPYYTIQTAFFILCFMHLFKYT